METPLLIRVCWRGRDGRRCLPNSGHSSRLIPLGIPTVRYKANNNYERAMIHKAIMWKNAWMKPRILEGIEEQNTLSRARSGVGKKR